jgi:hypothetical protein
VRPAQEPDVGVSPRAVAIDLLWGLCSTTVGALALALAARLVRL